MSDFLLNLARRSAGLEPVVQSRVDPAAEGLAGAEGDAADADAAPWSPHAPPAAAGPADPPQVRPIATPVAAVVERPIASLPVPLVQREPMAAVATTPIAPPVLSMAPLLAPTPEPRSPDAAPRLPLSAATFDPPVARSEPPTLNPAPAPERIVERRFESRVDHQLTRVIEPSAIPPREVDRIDVVRDEEHPGHAPIGEPSPAPVVLAPRLEPASEPAIPRLSPQSPRVAGPSQVAEPSQVVERTVQVRIGTIEIHGTDTPAPAAVPPAPLPPSAQGFDAFVRLRSYAPWSW